MVQYTESKKNGAFSVTFSCRAAAGSKLFLTGSFNDWDSSGIPMTPVKGDPGRSEIVLQLAPGYYEYKFIINGQWLPDEENPSCAANDFGTLNSVLSLEN